MKRERGATRVLKADARKLYGRIEEGSIDLVFTSPPYWQCRDYGHRKQIGQEKTPELYIQSLLTAINSWKPLLRSHASVIINIGDVFRKGSLMGIPAMLEIALREHGWLIVNRIVWAKDRGIPEPNNNRLASRHEVILHLALQKNFFFDLYALKGYLGQASNPGDVWHIEQTPSSSTHLAPFPSKLARRVILAACPEKVCTKCGKAYTRRLRASLQLDKTRIQARRAMQRSPSSKWSK
jgi:DNA modification methylase